MQRIQNYIGGKFCDPENGKWMDDYAPATGSVCAQIPDSGAADVQAAVDAAKAAFPGLAALSLDKRGTLFCPPNFPFSFNHS